MKGLTEPDPEPVEEAEVLPLAVLDAVAGKRVSRCRSPPRDKEIYLLTSLGADGGTERDDGVDLIRVAVADRTTAVTNTVAKVGVGAKASDVLRTTAERSSLAKHVVDASLLRRGPCQSR